MIWLTLALLTAFFESIKDVCSKKSLENFDEYVVSWIMTVFTALILSFSLLIIPAPKLGNNFWMALFIGGILNTIATLIYVKAIKISDLSITAPITSFTPFFLLLTSPIIVGERPNIIGFIGVMTIVAGSYFINFNERKNGYLRPIKKLFLEPGSSLVLIVSFIWSITSNFDKIGIQNSSPIFWAISMYTFISILMLFIVIFRLNKSGYKLIFVNADKLVLLGVFNAATVLCQMMALKLTLVTYVISVKRLSAIFSVLFGYFIFHESNLRERGLGAFIMVAGTFIIALSHTKF